MEPTGNGGSESANVVLSQWYGAQNKSFDHYLGLMAKEDGDEHWVRPTDNKSKVNTDAEIMACWLKLVRDVAQVIYPRKVQKSWEYVKHLAVLRIKTKEILLGWK